MLKLNSLQRLLKRKRTAKKTKRCRRLLSRISEFDKQRMQKFSGPFRDEQKASLAYAIGMEYHRVEKGLTMPSMRLGFGQPIVSGLIDLIRQYIQNGGSINDFEIHHALKVIAEYHQLHIEENYRLDDELNKKITQVLSEYPSVPSQQRKMTPASLWQAVGSDFKAFSASRHSVRHVEGKVPTQDIIESISLAQNAPSACNRQYVKVTLVENYDLVQKILALQNGNKGFGHLVEQLLLLTVDLRAIRWLAERHDVYTNAGVFAMNLSYALHYHKIAHCMLNWSVEEEPDRELREMLSIPDHENVVLMFMLGNAPANFKVPLSPRRPLMEILTIVDK